VHKHLVNDSLILIVCIAATLALVKSGLLDSVLAHIKDFGFIGAFVAGIFFTSVFTIAASTIFFIELGTVHSPIAIALIGALGGVIGDSLLFFFVRNRVTKDVDEMVQMAGIRPTEIIRVEFLRWLNPFLGALFISLPLPDELGLALLGFSKIRARTVALIVYPMHVIGIYTIIIISQAI